MQASWENTANRNKNIFKYMKLQKLSLFTQYTTTVAWPGLWLHWCLPTCPRARPLPPRTGLLLRRARSLFRDGRPGRVDAFAPTAILTSGPSMRRLIIVSNAGRVSRTGFPAARRLACRCKTVSLDVIPLGAHLLLGLMNLRVDPGLLERQIILELLAGHILESRR